MAERKIGIVADCVCDLPQEMIAEYGIEEIYFYIVTDAGRFRDRDEISAKNVFEYLEEGGEITSTEPPTVEEMSHIYGRLLKKYDELLHITVSTRLNSSYNMSTKALEKMGEDSSRIRVFNSENLSTGIGLMVLKAAEMADRSCTADEIITELESMKSRISTTFIAYTADYLYLNKRISKLLYRLCSALNIHPVLEMKNGKLRLKSMQMGNYERSMQRYVRSELDHGHVCDDIVFLTHSGCSVNDIRIITAEAGKYINTDNLHITDSSATISGNCGPRTFGVLFMRK